MKFTELKALAQINALMDEYTIWKDEYDIGSSEVNPGECTIYALIDYINAYGWDYDGNGKFITESIGD